MAINWVNNNLKRFSSNEQEPQKPTKTAFKENRADLLSIQQDRLINSLTDADIQKSSAYQKVGMFSLLYDKERLERDKSTSNIANVYSTLDTQHANYRQRIEELEAELGIDDVQDDVQDAEVVQDTPFPT